METLDEFFNREYTDFTNDKVFVYPQIRGKGKHQIWSIEQAKQYINYLKAEELEI